MLLCYMIYLLYRKGRSRSPNFNTSCYTYTCCMVPLISLVKKIPMGFTPVITAHCLASSCTEPGLRTKVLAEIKTKNQKLKKKKMFFFFWEPPPNLKTVSVHSPHPMLVHEKLPSKSGIYTHFFQTSSYHNNITKYTLNQTNPGQEKILRTIIFFFLFFFFSGFFLDFYRIPLGFPSYFYQILMIFL